MADRLTARSVLWARAGGLLSETAFRDGLAATLEKSFGVEVVNINDEGVVFAAPIRWSWIF